MLIKLIPSKGLDEEIFVDPGEVVVIKRCHYDRDMGEYSTLTMRNGEAIDVYGLPTSIAKQIREATE
jgi:hypothetical protein